MRVLQIISTLNIGSGIANFAMNYYRKIVDLGIQFDFLAFCTVEKGFEQEIKKMGGCVYYIEKPSLTTVARYKKTVKRFFEVHAGEWRCVHIHEILVQHSISKYARKYGKVNKILIHSHATKFVLPNGFVSPLRNFAEMQMKKLRNSFLLRGLKHNADCFLACSVDAGIALFGRHIVSGDRYHTVKNAILTEGYAYNAAIRAQYRKNMGLENKKVILLVGRLCEGKNQSFMLDVLKELRSKDDSYILLLVGEGPLQALLRSRAAELGLRDSVVFTGNRVDVPNLMQCADLFVLPSLAEGLGIVAIEAQAAGLPCIVSTGVPRETEITPYIRYEDLQAGIDRWEEIIRETKLVRHDAQAYISVSGYDIDQAAAHLYTIYTT